MEQEKADILKEMLRTTLLATCAGEPIIKSLIHLHKRFTFEEIKEAINKYLPEQD